MDDDPCKKARDFAITFQLNSEMEEGLCNLVRTYIMEHKEQMESSEVEDEENDI